MDDSGLITIKNGKGFFQFRLEAIEGYEGESADEIRGLGFREGARICFEYVDSTVSSVRLAGQGYER